VDNRVISSEEEVLRFLKDLKEVLSNPKFVITRDLDIMMKKKSESPIDPYTTANTLLELEFDSYDVYSQLLALDVREYLETIIDNLDPDLPPFFAFGKVIQKKDVYIKVKIRDRMKRKVFCVSFHFARYPFPQSRPFE
jgi:hypothetical protein